VKRNFVGGIVVKEKFLKVELCCEAELELSQDFIAI